MGHRDRDRAERETASREFASLFGAVFLLACACPAAAGGSTTSGSELDEMIVTGAQPHKLADVAKSVTVITAEDIAALPATSLAELLAREANVNLRSVTGNDKFAGIDIRGMGDTYVSNVLILVDGIRMNPADLAGADLASIALAQIERIEIVRGANAVRYGNGAVGGVINIMTRGPVPGRTLTAHLGAGSFDTRETSASAGYGGDPASAVARFAYYDTDGYRRNGGLRKTDVQLEGRAALSSTMSVDAAIHAHFDDYGLPGPISREAFLGSGSARRASDSPDDGGDTRDFRYRAGALMSLAGGQRVRALGSLRDRKNTYVIGYNPGLSRAEQETTITEDTWDIDLTYDIPAEIGIGRQEFTLGAEMLTTDYRRQEHGSHQIGQSATLLGDIDDVGIFAAGSWWFADDWQLSAGHRRNITRSRSLRRELREVCDFTLVIIPPGIPLQVPVNCRGENIVSHRERDRWNDSATETGLVWDALPNTDVFLGFSRSFRVPNVDELAASNGDLVPQKARHWEFGVRSRPWPALDVSVTLFSQRTSREILYGLDPDTGESTNRNATETTRRRGVELELRWRVTDSAAILANAGYAHARFAESGAPIPLVPEWTASVAWRWSITSNIDLSVSGRHVGERNDGNDFTGDTYPELRDYWLSDLQLAWTRGAYRWTVGIDNLFDEVAAGSAYSSRVYPLPARGLHAGVAASF